MSPDSPLTDLPPNAFQRLDETPDAEFYAKPRFVVHIDEAAIAAVTRLYREYFPPDGAILDLMSSWVSHLPQEIAYSRVAGLGMNREELATNPRLTEYAVHDLNANSALPYGSAEFDGCGICVSIDYLIRPVEVLREVARVLKAGASLVITFSDRCFPTKAIRIWNGLDSEGHARLVRYYLGEAGGYDAPALCKRLTPPGSDALWGVVARCDHGEHNTQD